MTRLGRAQLGTARTFLPPSLPRQASGARILRSHWESVGASFPKVSSSTEINHLVSTVRDSVIGRDDLLEGPFGLRPVIYADYTASGRSLSFIEEFLDEVVRPLYANTHTESSGTGRQTTQWREEARQIVADAVGAGDEHAVVFCGSGATYAITKIIGVLGLRLPSTLDDRFHLSDAIAANERPVVFVGPFEHHSNELPWRESIADVIQIGEDADGHISLDHLEAELVRHQDRPLLIGSFSAASNVTGIITDTAAVSSLLHRHGALSFWDFAAAAPYVSIDMGSSADDNLAYSDAVFISPHKFIGGPGTPGILVARRELFTNRVPVVPGGGTVTYVNETEHDYDSRIEHREEGGTPAIVESIRAGLVFQLKAAVGVETITVREEELVAKAISSWSANPAIDVLGSHDAERLSIVSFVIRHGPDQDERRYLHHNYVVALLNDLFGIQSRGGCSCAGPYGHRLLGIDVEQSHEFQREINRGCEGIKPGWVRVSFNYFIDNETLDYLVAAVHIIAELGHKLLPLYRFDPDRGLWHHRGPPPSPTMSLHDISYANGELQFANLRRTGPADFDHYLDEARRLCADVEASPPDPSEPPTTNPDFEHLRWFPYPQEAGP
ncbi:MAG: aminotransferase class V-fold PLP-dependent enzyme [Actinomycetia bacterium]|nr:aminotransferase class V-fold PLP-dependent enzyme [Actinomycetes bacterium]